MSTHSKNKNSQYVFIVCTWLASSLVGEMTTALKPWLAGCCRWASSGRQNASVFPEPVGAHTRTSRLCGQHRARMKTVRAPCFSHHWVHACVSALTCIMSGMACICTAVGESRPASFRFCRTRGLSRYSVCSSSNVHTGSGTSLPCTLIRCCARTRFTWNGTNQGHQLAAN